MADRGLELYEDFPQIIADRGLSYMKHLSPLSQTEGLSYMETFLHYGRQSFELYEDFSPSWLTEGLS